MAETRIPTKGNLLASKKSLALAKTGYDLLDRKRQVLLREMMSMMDKVKVLREQITESYQLGYFYLQQANMSTGVIADIANSIHEENSVKLRFRSVMGVEIPAIEIDDKPLVMEYGFAETSSKVDEAYIQFNKIKKLTMLLAEVDNGVYRLAKAISSTQKRANALKNIVIPNLSENIKVIGEALEEKEREEFSRLKVIKAKQTKTA
ncbi:MAG: V-type ATP synthase subunit D [Erysipelotrichaceae bacterium]|jgi:V/A-type H+-transporting ATPase subunit D|nr:V-type ATP synthase subunit D [Erysipelotrichaceae bacterium]